MRKGNNPNKDKALPKSNFRHQIVIPVFIPNQKGYFKDAFKILKISLRSIFETVSWEHTYLTIVNNGSCKELENYLNKLKEQEKINELINTSNIGKLNAISKGMAGHDFDLITIADADVYFLPGWQRETLNVFNEFPKAGSVGLVPQFNMFSNFCTNVLFDNFFNKNCRFYKLSQPEDMWAFYKSIGWNMPKKHYYFRSVMGISNKNEFKACIGSGHFVATYRKELFENLKKYIPGKMGAKSEQYLDKSAMINGLWKLTTFKNYAYHMGNAWEDWMDEMPKPMINEKLMLNSFSNNGGNMKFLKNKIFKNILRLKPINKWFLKYKQLPKEELKKYPRIYF